MGCDIHTIVEIRKNGKWNYIPECPDMFIDRNYRMFSMLNRDVRNYNNINGFNGKGLPKDISGMQYDFESERKMLEDAYNTKSIYVCYIGEKERKFISTISEELTVEIDEKLFVELSKKENKLPEERYYMPRKSYQDNKYYVQDANQVGGVFKEISFKNLYDSIEEFNKNYYNIPYHEKEQDFGFYNIDFTSTDLHSHSYLSLTELKEKMFDVKKKKSFVIEKDFVDHLLFVLEDKPEEMIVEETEDKTKVNVTFVTDIYEYYAQINYNKGVKELEELKEKYGITQDEDLRIVFAFDS